MNWLLGLTAVAALLAASPARAQGPLLARDTADVGAPAQYQVGVFNPLKVGLVDGLELQTQPLLFFVSPNAVFRVRHGEIAGFRFVGEYGIYCPTPAMMLLQGWLFPTWSQGGGKVGWWLVPSAGLAVSRGNRLSRVLTFNLDVAAGIPLTRHDLTPLSGVAPLEDLFAPVTSGFRTRFNVTYDAALLPWLRARAYLGLSVHGANPSPVGFNGGAGFDVAVGKQSRFTLGFLWWNADTGAIDETTHERYRNNDFFPTLDFIWAG